MTSLVQKPACSTRKRTSRTVKNLGMALCARSTHLADVRFRPLHEMVIFAQAFPLSEVSFTQGFVEPGYNGNEFKREAVKLVTEQGYTQAEAARSLGINPNLIRRWRLKFAPKTPGMDTMSETEQQELIRLREEVRRLRMERDILKKATAFFASEKS